MHLCRCPECRREIARLARRASQKMLRRELERVRREQRELGQDEDLDFLDDDDDDDDQEE